MDLFFELLPEEDIPTAHAIELDGFPPDEAATLEAFRYRQGNAPDLFLGAYIAPRQLVGYVCSTASSFPTLTHESMSKHEPNAPSVCIHSVCVAPNHRKKGIALRLLQSYLDRLQSTTSYERVLLITHEELRVLYEAAGFEFVGESAVQHGPKPWFEMRKVLRSPLTHVLSEGRQDTIDSSLGQPAIAQADILAALMQQQSSSRTRPPAALLDSFNEGAVGTSVPVGSDLVNAYALVCPRAGCGSTILLARAATLVEKESIQLEPTSSPNPHLLPLPPAGSTTQWWLVTPSPMAFENIGFSRPVGSSKAASSSTAPRKPIKLLICAECDLGPLGWCEEGGREFWLAPNRVAYRL